MVALAPHRIESFERCQTSLSHSLFFYIKRSKVASHKEQIKRPNPDGDKVILWAVGCCCLQAHVIPVLVAAMGCNGLSDPTAECHDWKTSLVRRPAMPSHAVGTRSRAVVWRLQASEGHSWELGRAASLDISPSPTHMKNVSSYQIIVSSLSVFRGLSIVSSPCYCCFRHCCKLSRSAPSS